MLKARVASAIVLAILCTASPLVRAEDWPTWRHDSGRSGATGEQLAADLHLQWTLRLPKLKPAWPEDVRLQFDASYEPIIVGDAMFLSSGQNDSVSAYNLTTGKRKWRFFAGGPVRFAPVASAGRLFFGADDGTFHCLDAATGKLIWKFQAAPTERNVIGNERFCSVWPMRGGPVLSNGRVYFTVGVWPFEGTMLYTLNVSTGELEQVESTPPEHTSISLNNVAPQGYLVRAGDNLFVPCGRANVFGVDLRTGRQRRLSYSARGSTDYHVVASEKWLLHGGKIVDIKANRTLSANARRPVIQNGVAYSVIAEKAVALDLNKQDTVEKKDRRGKITKTSTPHRLWQFDKKLVGQVHTLAGNQLYVSNNNSVVAISLPNDGETPKSAWTADVGAKPTSVLAANGKLVVVTERGEIRCFAAEKTTPQLHVEAKSEAVAANDDWTAKAAEIMKSSKSKSGYCVALNIGSGRLIEELIGQSNLHVIALDDDAAKVASLQSRLDKKGLYGSRCTARVGNLSNVSLPPFMANLVVSEAPAALGQSAAVASLFNSLRPYGGSAVLTTTVAEHESLAKAVESNSLVGAKLTRASGESTLSRVGPLPGAADWTHEFGDPANTLMSREKRVKAPLGVLWFGGPSSDGSLFFDRHQWGPSMAVIEGRMFIQGPGKFTAVDVYTGRILWQNKIPFGLSPGRGSNWGPTGYHFVVAKDGVYLTFAKKCLRLDPETGEQTREFTLADKEDSWGRIRIVGDRMFVPVFQKVDGKSDPKKLVVMDRNTGKLLWSKTSEMSFPLIAIGNDKVFCYEGLLEGLYVGAGKNRVKGAPKAGPILNIKSFDARTGKELWSRTTPRSASWLAYAVEEDVLLVSNKQGIDAWQGENGDELWSKEAEGKGFLGHPENYWDKVIIWKGQILDQRGPGKSYDVRTGDPRLLPNPITDEQVPWEFTKVGHHCNYAIASEHLMTFRAAAAGFLDLNNGGTSRLEGFRSGCRNSLIPANGVLNAPNFAHGCSCSFSIFTSLALVHVPETDLWSYGATKVGDGPVKRLGINFAAPGDRRTDDKTLWLNYPKAGGPSPKINLKVSSAKTTWFRLHSRQLTGDGLNWVSATGMRGVQSVKIPLAVGKSAATAPPRKFTVRLHFAEPKDVEPGTNVFDVAIQGETVLENFDVVAEAKGQVRTNVVQEISGIAASKEMAIVFTPKKGQTLICGIEIREDPTQPIDDSNAKKGSE
jgi:outer membrane protein assembly factor BamB